jgi:two-component system nitrogen regulation response regulator NtrX
LQAVAERVPAAIFLDIWLQDSELDGLGILEILQTRHKDVPVIMISGHGSVETAVTAMKRGAYDFIEKPFKEEHLLLVLQRALRTRRLELENQDLRQKTPQTDRLVGQSSAMQQLRQQLERVAAANSRILITGAAGTGKALVAERIHQQSPRRNNPFVTLSAPNMAPDRVELELFGEEDTASANGGAKTIGLLERAHGGTVFIDEVADMPLATQGKILRMVHEQRFERLGGSRSVEVDVRIVVATSKDMQACIAQGSFREDLYYRLNVVPLYVPSLVERREDIEELCEYFLSQFSAANGLAPRKIGKEAMALLQVYRWPGNVRQLRNLMEWMLIMAPGEPETPIRANMLPPEFFYDTPVSTVSDINADIMCMPLKEAREFFERQYLRSQIDRFGGNISKTSAFIGMERSALHRKLKMLELAGSERVTGDADTL